MAKEEEEAQDFQGFGVVDLDNLEREAARHSKRVEDYGLAKEAAQGDLVDAEKQLELTEAELRLKIVKSPDRYDLPEKPAEKIVSAAIVTQAKYRAALDERDAAKRRVAVLAVALNALEHRKKMIEKLVDLFHDKYWSIPRTKVREEQEREEDRKVAERARKRRE